MRISIIIKAAAAFVAGVFITFSQAHDANVAMLGLVIISAGWIAASIVDVIKNKNPYLSGFILLSAGTMIYQAVSFEANNATTMAWILLEAWGFFGAIAELIFALRAGRKSSARRDHLISAVLALGLFGAQVSVTAASDSVSHVGFFGAYAILVAVHLGISAASPTVASTKA